MITSLVLNHNHLYKQSSPLPSYKVRLEYIVVYRIYHMLLNTYLQNILQNITKWKREG